MHLILPQELYFSSPIAIKEFLLKKKKKSSVLLHTGFKEETIYKHHLTSERVFGTLVFDIGHFCSNAAFQT